MPTLLDYLVESGVANGADEVRVRVALHQVLIDDPAMQALLSEVIPSDSSAVMTALLRVEQWLERHDGLAERIGLVSAAQVLKDVKRFLKGNENVMSVHASQAAMRDYLFRTGARFGPNYSAHLDINKALHEHVKAEDAQGARELTALLQLPEYAIPVLLAMIWSHSGYPEIQMGHRLATWLMLQEVPQEGVIEPPWEAFFIQVPPGLIATRDHLGTPRSIYGILAAKHLHSFTKLTERHLVWTFIVLSDLGPLLFNYFGLEEDLRKDQFRGLDLAKEVGASYSYDQLDERVLVLARRMVLNTCLAAQRSKLTPIGKHPKPSHSQGVARPFKIVMDAPSDQRVVLQAFLREPVGTS